MSTTFIRLVEAKDKALALREALNGASASKVFQIDPASFSDVPRSPFAYWVGTQVRRLFRTLGRLESCGRHARLGASTKNDARFLRLAWEVPRATRETSWKPFIKGGSYSKFYMDVHMVVNWRGDAREIEAEVLRKYPYLDGNADFVLHRELPYGCPGLTWSARSQVGLSLRAMPKNCIFSHKGPAVFEGGSDATNLLALLAVTNSRAFAALVELQMAFGSYEVGVLQRTPVPVLDLASRGELAAIARRAWATRRSLDTWNESSHAFVLPALLQFPGSTLVVRAKACLARIAEGKARLDACQRALDDLCFARYQIGDEDRAGIENGYVASVVESTDEHGTPDCTSRIDLAALTYSLLGWAAGVSFGRFDARAANSNQESRREPEPFDPLPPCAPGMLTGSNGLPIDDPGPEYPVVITQEGILVSDSGHERDLVAQTRQVFQFIFGADADERWREVEEILESHGRGVRAWFANSLFEEHIKHYSKSRRKAPIYWQLATLSASYSVWLYYHRFTRDTLYRVLNDYITPKLKHEERKLDGIHHDAGHNPSAAQRKESDAQERFVNELRAFRDEVARVAPLWSPNLNDGVIINFAPLWRLVPQHRVWQKECKSTWDKLCRGDYDWAHLAMHLWPERVVPKCAKDRSLAIAHGLEGVFWSEDSNKKWSPRKVRRAEVDALIKQRTSAAVKDALKSLLEAPAPAKGRASKAKPPRVKGALKQPAFTRPEVAAGRATARSRSAAGLDAVLVRKVKATIRATAKGATKADILNATGISASEWSKLIKALVADGSVTKVGERSRTRYRLDEAA